MHPSDRDEDLQSKQVCFADFTALDFRKGTIVSVIELPKARIPAYVLEINFGPIIGLKKSSAQVTDLYKIHDLLGKSIIAIINFAPKQIGQIMSEVLVVGLPNADGHIVLVSPETTVPDGARLS